MKKKKTKKQTSDLGDKGSKSHSTSIAERKGNKTKEDKNRAHEGVPAAQAGGGAAMGWQTSFQTPLRISSMCPPCGQLSGCPRGSAAPHRGCREGGAQEETGEAVH